MDFVIDKDTLLSPLQLVSSLVDKKQTLPIISNVLLQIHNNQLSLTTTNLEVELRAQRPLTVDSPDVQTTVPARKLHDVVSMMPEGSILQCSLTENQLQIHAASLDMDLTVLPAAEFPTMKGSAIQSSETTLTLPQNELQKLIEKTAFSMAIQDVRFFLNGMLFDVREQTLHVVATDGHRLATSSMALGREMPDQRIIIPRKGVFELLRILDGDDTPVDMVIQDNTVKLTTKTVEYSSKLVDGDFPNYVQVIPNNPRNYFQVETQQLIKGLERTAVVLQEKPKGTKLHLDSNSLTLQTTNALGERAKESLTVEYQGEPAQLAYNTDYLLEALRRITSEKIRISFNEPNESCLIEEVEGDATQFVIMAMIF